MTDGGLTYIGEATPYHYIGDSHAGVIGTLALENADGERIVTRVSGIWRFVASDMVEPDGLISEPVMQALRRIAAFHSSPAFPPQPGLRSILTTYGSEKLLEHLAVTQRANDTPYVLNVGEINARYILHELVTNGMDFAVPFPTNGLERLSSKPATLVLSSEDMLRLLAERFSPLFRGLRILRDAGLRTIYLHCLPPPTPDDADSQKVLKHASPGRLRYKLAMFINYLYEAVCREIGVGFINTWPLVTHNDILNPDYYLDGLHLNRKHAVLSIREVYRQFSADCAAAQELAS